MIERDRACGVPEPLAALHNCCKAASGKRESEQFRDSLAAIDDLERATLRRQVLLARIDIESTAEGAEEIRHANGTILDRGAVGRAAAEDHAALDARAGDGDVEA